MPKSEKQKSSRSSTSSLKSSQAIKDAEALKKAFAQMHIEEFVRYLRSPWRIIWTNLLAGIFRGLGIIIGMTVVFAFLIWLLSGLVDFPVIGQYFTDLKEILEEFSQIKQIAR